MFLPPHTLRRICIRIPLQCVGTSWCSIVAHQSLPQRAGECAHFACLRLLLLLLMATCSGLSKRAASSSTSFLVREGSEEDLSRNKHQSHNVPAARRPTSAAVSVRQVPIQQPLIETSSAEPQRSHSGCVSGSKSSPYRVSQPCFDQGWLKSTFDLGSLTRGSLVSSGSTLTSNAS